MIIFREYVIETNEGTKEHRKDLWIFGILVYRYKKVLK